MWARSTDALAGMSWPRRWALAEAEGAEGLFGHGADEEDAAELPHEGGDEEGADEASFFQPGLSPDAKRAQPRRKR